MKRINVKNCKPLIKMLVDRNNVHDSNLTVIRDFVKALHDHYKQWMSYPKRSRKALMKAIIKAHHENRKQYCLVMSGRKPTDYAIKVAFGG